MKQKHTLAEIESSLRKVAQAVGLDWGLAEEAGKAARWLSAFELPGAEITVAHLRALDGEDYHQYLPTNLDAIWQARGDRLCPIVTGAALADRSSAMLSGTEFKLGPVAYPILMAATVGQAARFHQATFNCSWSDVSVSCYKNGIRIEGNREDLLLPMTGSALCRQSSETDPQILPRTLACDISDDSWSEIEKLAFKTYAPATAESRAGAGAGLTDND